MAQRRTKQDYLSKTFGSVSDVLPDRSVEIIRARFGIDSAQPQTLEYIGQEYGITRERVRQIVSSSVKAVAKQETDKLLKKVYESITQAIDERSGIIPEKDVLSRLGGDDYAKQGMVRFFLECAPNVVRVKESDELIASHALEDFDLSTWRSLKDTAHGILHELGDVLHEEHLLEKVREQHSDLEHETILHFLAPAQEIEQNSFGKWGLSHWGSVRPKGVREKIYLVLRESEKPLHFREIATLIDTYNLGKKKRSTHPQTVHNELIKDERFVLVGRGMYGLSQWGMVPGTIKDVITKILQDHGGPLSADEIVTRVVSNRDVKPSTILINLRNHFTKLDGNLYTL